MDFSALYTRTSIKSQSLQDSHSKYAAAVTEAAKSKDYQRVADSVLAKIQSVNYNSSSPGGNVPATGRPQLAAPTFGTAEGKKESQDGFTFLMASVMNLLGDANIYSQKSRMDILKQAAKDASKANQALLEKYDKVVAEAEAAVASASGSEEKLASAKANLERAEKELAAADKALGEIEPGTPEHDEALGARDLAQGKVNDAQQQKSKAEVVHIDALKVAGEALIAAEALAKETEKMVGANPAIKGVEKQLNSAAQMTLLLMKCAELMGDSAESKIGMEQALFKEMQSARKLYMEKKAEEYLQQVEKAEAASKAMGCVGKIVGAVLLVASVVAAAFTAGASLAISVIGIALMAGDMVGKAITGVSFMDEAMKPLMESVLAPLIDLIGKGITKGLDAMGVDQKTADMVGKIMGAISAAVIMVTVMVVVATVGKSAASKLGPMMSKVLGKAIGKMVPGMVKQVTRSITKGYAKAMVKIGSKVGLKLDSVAMGKISAKMGIAMAVVEAGGATTQAGLGIKTGIHQRDAEFVRAELIIAMALSDSAKNWLSDMVQYFDRALGASTLGIKKVLDMQSNSEGVGLSMARNI